MEIGKASNDRLINELSSRVEKDCNLRELYSLSVLMFIALEYRQIKKRRFTRTLLQFFIIVCFGAYTDFEGISEYIKKNFKEKERANARNTI